MIWDAILHGVVFLVTGAFIAGAWWLATVLLFSL